VTFDLQETALVDERNEDAGLDLASSVVRALAPDSLLGSFNRAGVLAPADLHVARCLARLAGEPEEAAVLAAALAVRAPRVGHVYADLSTIRATAGAAEENEAAIDALDWPDPDGWIRQMAASPMVVSRSATQTSATWADSPRPLVLEGSALYLDRLWQDETAVAAALVSRAGGTVAGIDGPRTASLLERLYPGDVSGEQRRAAAIAISRRLSVIVGGPGTGKTTTVARMLGALFAEAQATGDRPPLVALAAPTGKAAARLAEAVHLEASECEIDAPVRDLLQGLEASTVHRLLGRRPDSDTRFRYHAGSTLPYDVVVVDETSMLPLWLMARLLEATRADARLVLVGDPEQLTSVEAGAVLADVAGPVGGAATAGRPGSQARATVSAVAEPEASLPGSPPATSPEIAECVVALRQNHRFRGALADLADAVRSGDADGGIEILREGASDLQWIEGDASSDPEAQLLVSDRAVTQARRLVESARTGNAEACLEAVGDFRLLCAHRRGPAGATTWNDHVQRLLAADPGVEANSEWYLGRPVIVTANDYSLRLFNGDIGVVVPRHDGTVGAVFRRGGELISVSPSTLEAVATVYAMTVHKAQGSEFEEVTIVLPEPSSRILTRELLYTALTRATSRVLLVGTEDAVRAGIERRISRASGLLRRLWGMDPQVPGSG
jgi:exodeoxyribonuclease V alpha subunit